jgi:7tm Odorant receptor
MDFINARNFKPDDEEIFKMREQRFLLHRKAFVSVLIFSWFTVVYTCFVIRPFTETQKLHFPEDNSFIFWFMYFFAFATHVSSSALVISAGFFSTNMILYIAFEFKLLGFVFGRLLNDIEEKPKQEDVKWILKELARYVKHHQKLLL